MHGPGATRCSCCSERPLLSKTFSRGGRRGTRRALRQILITYRERSRRRPKGCRTAGEWHREDGGKRSTHPDRTGVSLCAVLSMPPRVHAARPTTTSEARLRSASAPLYVFYEVGALELKVYSQSWGSLN